MNVTPREIHSALMPIASRKENKLGVYFTCYACFNTGDEVSSIYHDRSCWVVSLLHLLEKLTGESLTGGS